MFFCIQLRHDFVQVFFILLKFDFLYNSTSQYPYHYRTRPDRRFSFVALYILNISDKIYSEMNYDYGGGASSRTNGSLIEIEMHVRKKLKWSEK